MKEVDLNSPERFHEIRKILNRKPSLRSLYNEVYQKYLSCIDRSPKNGIALEIGTGGGFTKEVIPDMVTSDVVAYPGIDKVLDGTNLSFPSESVSCICMFNVLHHISNTPAFFKESIRCLLPGGRILMVEPYPGFFGSFIYRYIHHEDFNPTVEHWEFESNGPVSDANNALPYIIFERDRKKFQTLFPQLSIEYFKPHTPLRYWLTGGLKSWSLLPEQLFKFMSWIDRVLIKITPKFGSFVDIELVKL